MEVDTIDKRWSRNVKEVNYIFIALKALAINMLNVCVLFFQAELKVLTDMASPSFNFARDLLRHNLVCPCVCLSVCQSLSPDTR